MKYLEITAALRRATKEDVLVGDINDIKGVQELKDCTTVFYLNKKTKQIHGPSFIYRESDFTDIFSKVLLGMIGVIAPIPNVITNEYIFDLVLREASIDDLVYRDDILRKNRMYYIYSNKMISGPYYVNNENHREKFEELISKQSIFVPHERQHFKKKELKKAA